MLLLFSLLLIVFVEIPAINEMTSRRPGRFKSRQVACKRVNADLNKMWVKVAMGRGRKSPEGFARRRRQ